jgi:PEP-CTERM motif
MRLSIDSLAQSVRTLAGSTTLCLAVSAVAVLGAGAAHATPITYVFGGLATGAWLPVPGGSETPFFGTAFTITVTADTSAVVPITALPNSFRAPYQSVVYNLAGLGLFNGLDAGSVDLVQINPFAPARIYLAIGGSGPLFGGVTIGATGYDLRTTLPTSNMSYDFSVMAVSTDRGLLFLRDAGPTPTFSATLNAVPEPGTFALALLAFVGLVWRTKAKDPASVV